MLGQLHHHIQMPEQIDLPESGIVGLAVAATMPGYVQESCFNLDVPGQRTSVQNAHVLHAHVALRGKAHQFGVTVICNQS